MTLTEVSFYSRRFAPVGIIVALVILIFFFGFRLLLLYLEIQSTAPPPPPASPVATNQTFGSIKPPQIPEAKPSSNYTWVLDTLDGTPNVEEATSAAKVYFVPQKTATFGFLAKIYAMAKAAGIDTSLIQHRLDDKIAVFDDGIRKMSIDIRNFNFSYDYKVTEADSVDTVSDPNLESTIISSAISFLTKVDRYPTELSMGDRNVIYMRLDPGTRQVSTLTSAAGANMAEVDFFLQDIDGRPVVTSTYYNSPNYVLVLTGGGEIKPIRAKIAYFERSQDQIGVYPLRTAEQAWADLQSGNGMVVSSTADSGEVTIQKVFLAYYEPDVYQEYIQPVYVFLGENRFVAYVPAVAPEALQ